MRELTAAGRAWLRAAVDSARRRAEARPGGQGRKAPVVALRPPPTRPAAVFEHERQRDQKEADHA